MNVQVIKKFAAVCKQCGDIGPEAYSFETAAKAARDKGWTDRCADCRKVTNPRAIPAQG